MENPNLNKKSRNHRVKQARSNLTVAVDDEEAPVELEFKNKKIITTVKNERSHSMAEHV